MRQAAAAAVAALGPAAMESYLCVYGRQWPLACCQTVLGSSVSLVSCDLSLCCETPILYSIRSFVRSTFHACVALCTPTRRHHVRHMSAQSGHTTACRMTHGGPPLGSHALRSLALSSRLARSVSGEGCVSVRVRLAVSGLAVARRTPHRPHDTHTTPRKRDEIVSYIMHAQSESRGRARAAYSP